MSAHRFLRDETRAAHEAVDASFAGLDLAKRDDYAAFLVAHAAAFLPAEEALTAAGADLLMPDWSVHRRGALLAADLADMGVALPPPASAPRYDDEAAILGGAYVLEGSRLGGAMLRRQVGEGLPRRFLDAVQPPGRWRGFIALLEQKLYTEAEQRRARDAALSTFALFGVQE
ncbi:biliverdin-producing heme oxygenase [Sphingomonas sp. ASV193]|uniref:biliverdin-producing heme oxygenase n=1 Tax=Sphingomonas sp. ASV193 TaxID=3144405 RepID=UPI0032E898D7